VGAIRHQEQAAGDIVDRTVGCLPPRACRALAFASQLPPDSIPWEWLHQLTEPVESPAHRMSPDLPADDWDDWAATRRLLEGRRLLTPADNPGFARMHRWLTNFDGAWPIPIPKSAWIPTSIGNRTISTAIRRRIPRYWRPPRLP
jgi:hypothetical protein